MNLGYFLNKYFKIVVIQLLLCFGVLVSLGVISVLEIHIEVALSFIILLLPATFAFIIYSIFFIANVISDGIKLSKEEK